MKKGKKDNEKQVFASITFFMGIMMLVAMPALSQQAAVSDIVSLNEALTKAVTDIGSRVQGKTEIAIASINAPLSGISDFLTAELSGHLTKSGKFNVLDRSKVNAAMNSDKHKSDLVNDKEAAEIGQKAGAKVVVTGSFSRFSGFSQLRVRAIDVRTSQVLSMHSARIKPDDTALANVMRSMGTAPVVAENALALLNRAQDLILEEKHDEAIRELDKALAINKDAAEGYFYRGDAYYYKKDYDRSIADFTQAIRLNSNYTEAYLGRGNSYSAKGVSDRAIADWETVLRLNPNHPKVKDYIALVKVMEAITKALPYLQRGLTYYDRKDYDLAIAEFTEVIRLKPSAGYSDIFQKAYYNRGNAYYFSKGDIDRAIADYSQAILLDADYMLAYQNRAAMYYNKKEYARTIEDFTQVIRLSPNDVNAYFGRGLANIDLKNYDQAISDWEMVLRLDPNNKNAKSNIVIAYFQRGVTYYNNRNYNQAIADWETVLRLDPNNKNAKDNIEIARQLLGR